MNSMISDFAASIETQQLNLAGVAVMQHGELLAEHRWLADTPHNLFSVSKSFTSTAIGMAVGEGLLSLSDQPKDVFSHSLPDETIEKIKDLTLRDLLTMSSGHGQPCLMRFQREYVLEPDWVTYFLEQPMVSKPGTQFMYDTGCTYVASAMLEEKAGCKLIDYLMPRLFDPLGIYRPMWAECPLGRNLGGAGLYLRTTELLKLGQLYLQKGMWEGEQLVPEKWISQACSPQIATGNPADATAENPDWQYGYGYQFWMNHNGGFRADGANSQFCIVDKKLDAVIAITAMEERSQAVLHTVWNEIYPKLEILY